METVKNTTAENEYWSNRYENQQTGWDLGAPSPPLKDYIDQLENKEIRILIPGAGNAHEAEYLLENGFKNVFVMDISDIPLQSFAARNPDFPKAQLIHSNFFEHRGTYDLILEQTFFCSFSPTPSNRILYGETMSNLLDSDGKLVGVWFEIPLIMDTDKRPFGGNRAEYLTYLSPHFEVKTFEKCYNSIKPRDGNEVFGIFQKKSKN